MRHFLTQYIIEMQKLFGNPENLTVEELIQKYRYTQNVPYWQTPEALEWAEHHRNSDDIQTKLPLIKDANKYVKKINDIIPIVAYISIRPAVVMNGTQIWLDKYDFPEAPLICRSINLSAEEGSRWKAGVLENLYPKVRGIIDDNASVLKFLKPDYPGTVFLFSHEHYSPNHIRTIPCKDWPATYGAVKDNIKLLR
jgi:hypothetical protein